MIPYGALVRPAIVVPKEETPDEVGGPRLFLRQSPSRPKLGTVSTTRKPKAASEALVKAGKPAIDIRHLRAPTADVLARALFRQPGRWRLHRRRGRRSYYQKKGAHLLPPRRQRAGSRIARGAGPSKDPAAGRTRFRQGD